MCNETAGELSDTSGREQTAMVDDDFDDSVNRQQ